jgi:hypothetical protein
LDRQKRKRKRRIRSVGMSAPMRMKKKLRPRHRERKAVGVGPLSFGLTATQDLPKDSSLSGVLASFLSRTGWRRSAKVQSFLSDH